MVGQFQVAAAKILQCVPGLATLTETTAQRQGRDGAPRMEAPSTKLQVEVRDLLTSEPVRTVTLSDEPKTGEDQRRSFGINDSDRIQERNGVVVVQAGKRLFVLSADELGKDVLKPGVHWELGQQQITISPDRPTTVALKASGGKGPVEYSLTTETPWLEIDRSTGRLTITPEQAMPKILTMLVERMGSGMPQPAGDSAAQSPVARYQREVGKMYSRLTGQAPTGLPVLVMAGVAAKDSEQVIASMQMGFLMDVPADLVNSKIKQLREKQEQERQRIETAQAAMMERMRPQPSAKADNQNVAELQRKIAELERRNIELESQVKLLKEMLSDKGGGTK
jgi:hypothetical protein